MSNPPRELLDPDGEGIYMLDEWPKGNPFGWSLIEASRRLSVFDNDGRLDWRSVDMELVYMECAEDGETWRKARSAWRRTDPGWRLNLPRRWRPAAYIYCTPKPEFDSSGGRADT
jgi:hypothetical protein